MAKSTVATATRTAEELKSDLKRLIRAIVDDDDVKAENFEEASKALTALRDLRSNDGSNGVRRKNGAVESARVPDHFLCPISSEIMKDPVVLASGQTYDRPFIQEWLNSGNRTCPQTQQVLTNPTLTPNLLIRSMISNWCSEHGIAPPSPTTTNHNNPDEPPITASERKSVTTLLNNLSCPSIPVKKQAAKDLRRLTKQKTSVRFFIGQDPDAIPQLLSVLSDPDDHELLEDAVTTVLNLSIFERNKKILGDNPQAIPLLSKMVSAAGTMQARANAAAALFSLSALDSNKVKIGESGGMAPLVDLLENGSLEARRDAANAMYNLCTNSDNRVRAVKEGVARVLMKMIMEKFLIGESLTILAMVSGNRKAADEIVEVDGLICLLQIARKTTCARNKENAIVIVYSLCVDHRMKLREVGEEEDLHGTISDIVSTGTSRARRKAMGILERLRRKMHNTNYSC